MSETEREVKAAIDAYCATYIRKLEMLARADALICDSASTDEELTRVTLELAEAQNAHNEAAKAFGEVMKERTR